MTKGDPMIRKIKKAKKKSTNMEILANTNKSLYYETDNQYTGL